MNQLLVMTHVHKTTMMYLSRKTIVLPTFYRSLIISGVPYSCQCGLSHLFSVFPTRLLLVYISHESRQQAINHVCFQTGCDKALVNLSPLTQVSALFTRGSDPELGSLHRSQMATRQGMSPNDTRQSWHRPTT